MKPIVELSRVAAVAFGVWFAIVGQNASAQSIVVPPVDLNQGLVGHWTGDGNARDWAGNDNGNPHGGVTYVDGPGGKAFSFDGTGGIGLLDEADLEITQSLSLSAWVRITDLPPIGAAGGQIVFRGDDRDGLDPYEITVTPNDQLTFQCTNEDNQSASVDVPAPLGIWILVTGTLTSINGATAMVLYIDGDAVAAKQSTVHPMKELSAKDNPGLGIGDVEAGSSHTDEKLTGDIADVRIYNRSLSPAEVKALYLAGLELTDLRVSVGAPLAGGDSTGTVQINASASASPIIVALKSSDPTVLALPASVVVPPGYTIAQFPIKTAPQTSPTRVEITATLNGKIKSAGVDTGPASSPSAGSSPSQQSVLD